MTTSITPGQEKQFERSIDDAAHRATRLILDKLQPGEFRMQQLLSRGDDIAGSIIGAAIHAARKAAPKRTLEAFAGFGLSATRKDVLVALLTPADLGLTDRVTLAQVLDPDRAKAWSEDVLENQLVRICSAEIANALLAQRTCSPGKKVLVTGHVMGDEYARLVLLDGEEGKGGWESFRSSVPVKLESLFLFELIQQTVYPLQSNREAE